MDNEKLYYLMLHNVHVVLHTVEQFNLWAGEIYEEIEFDQAGLKLEFLLEKGVCKRLEKDDGMI